MTTMRKSFEKLNLQTPFQDHFDPQAGRRLNGTPNDDRLKGTDGADTLQGLAGDDILKGSFGNDTLEGGKGHDIYFGGFGNDVMVDNEGKGKDIFLFDRGFDKAFGGGGADIFIIGTQLGHKAYTAEIEDFQLGVDKINRLSPRHFENGRPMQHIMDHFVANTDDGLMVTVTYGGRPETLIIDGYKYDGVGDVVESSTGEAVSHDDRLFW